jgi:hypothetical protein
MSAQAAHIEAADRAAHHWRFPEPGPLRVDTDRHRQAACGMFHETFNSYKPSVTDWPRFDLAALRRLTSLPIWDIAVQTEGNGRLRMQRHAESLPDNAWRAHLARAARCRMGLSGHRVQRMHRQFLCVRSVRIGQALRLAEMADPFELRGLVGQVSLPRVSA